MKMLADFDKEGFKKEVITNVKTLFRKPIEEATPQQVFQAVSYAVKDDIIDRWIATHKEYEKKNVKTVYYLSMEFLMGRALGNNLINLTYYDAVKEALDELGFDLNFIEDQEPDAALGNGGLGRLAACFLDSLATLGYPAYGCGIRYKYGMFKQGIKDGYQVEMPDDWLKDGNPFEVKRSEYAVEVKFGGYVRVENKNGRNYFIQDGYQSVRAVPYDLPVIGYGNNVVNTLRIWDAEAIQEFCLDSFDKGEYEKAVEQQNLAKTIVEVLYPNDNHYAGKELRLRQQYFFISASVQRAILKFKELNKDDIVLPTEKIKKPARAAVAIDSKKVRTMQDDRVTFTEEQIRSEASRCLSCGRSVVDPNKCIGCGICTTKCEFDAIHLKRVRPQNSKMIPAEDKFKAIGPYAAKRQVKIIKKSLAEKKK